MKRLILAALLGGAALLAGCEEPAPAGVETAQPPIEATPAPVEPAAPTEAEKGAPVDGSTLPPDQRASEETVKPESETLFY
jgi:PBP1b-binding outer membrane lipoprotein LpoB